MYFYENYAPSCMCSNQYGESIQPAMATHEKDLFNINELEPVDLGPRRIPRVYREVIYAPRPPPTFRRIVSRERTPERDVIERVTIRKSPTSSSSFYSMEPRYERQRRYRQEY